ncbi:MAG: YitT family protein [Clostridia bacterium]|nr:YitT family protein [Clostridia bacterium]
MKPFPKKFKKFLQTSLFLLVGNAILAFGVAAFIIPKNILMGGTTGIGILLSHFIPVETSLIVLILNVILLIAGLFILGKKFFFTTVVSSILYPVMLGIMQRIPGIEGITDNLLLAVILGGAILGISIGMVMRVGSSTGGLDVLALMLNKWTHLPVAILVYVCDIVVLVAQLFAGSTPESLLFGIVLIVLQSIVLDKVMILGKSQIQLFIVTDKFSEVRHALLTTLEAGVTMVKIETGLLLNDQDGIICVIPPRKLYAATELIHSIDPNAFITVTQIKEVRGRGFTQERLQRIEEKKEK